MALELRKNHFQIIISTTFSHIQLKFYILMRNANIQVEFEFDSGPFIFKSYASWSMAHST